MNRTTYPVTCCWCGAWVRDDSQVPGSTGICAECAQEMREIVRAEHHDEAADERRKIIDEAWHQPSTFMDGFLIGGAVATLLGILAHWAIHYFH